MRRVVCPGSFDPITNGHLDIIARACSLFDEVVIAVLVNQTKSSLFTVEERIEMIKEVTTRFSNIKVDSWSGLLVDYCREVGASVLIKGVRNNADLEYELPMARVNRDLASVETIFMPADPSQGFVSSSLVKQVAELGGSVDSYVPAAVVKALKASIQQAKG